MESDEDRSQRVTGEHSDAATRVLSKESNASVPPTPEPGAPERLGRYVVLGTLGQGGMGVVLEAFDRTLDRRVALKVLHRELDEQHAARLLREAQALAKLSHPNVVQVYEAGEADGRGFVAMELVGGRTLRDFMRQDPRPGWRECVQVFVQVGAGLAAAHTKGLVHRDFKPGNAILDEDGRARVLDFGLARQAEGLELDEHAPVSELERTRPDPEAASDTGSALDTPLTRTGAVMGTPAYMPLEQMLGREIDARCDQFSFCVSLWEAVYGQRPYAGHTMGALLVALNKGQIEPVPKDTRVPAKLRTALLRGLATKPEDRWPSMDALLEQLQRLVAPRGRRWLAVGLTGGLAVLGGGLALAQYAEVKDRCTGARAQLSGIWDEGRVQALKDAFLGTEQPNASDSWQQVEARLDEYAQQWVAKHTEVCEATRVTQAQTEEAMDLRMGCLRERRLALRAVVGVLAEADAETVTKATKVVTTLPGLERCDDLVALRAMVPPPEDPEVAGQVEVLRERLAELTAQEKAGKVVGAEEEVARAEALGYGPLVAEAKYLQGIFLSRNQSNYAEAERGLVEAYELAIEQRNDDVARKAAQMLLSVVGVHQVRHAEGLVWGRTALAYARRSGEELKLSPSLATMGQMLLDEGEYEQAQRYLEQAIELTERAGGPDHPSVAMILGSLGNLLRERGELEQAQLVLERSLRISEKALGAEHPNVASILHSLGAIVSQRGNQEQARLHFERALRISEKTLGPDHPDVAANAMSVGVVLRHQGELEQAQLLQERALRIFENALGPDHPHVALTLSNLSLVLEEQGELEQARLRQERALSILEKVLGTDHKQVGAILGNLGALLLAQGEHEQARLHYERALRIYEKAVGADHPEVSVVLIGLANVGLAEEDFDVARTHAERAVSMLEKDRAHPDDLAWARFMLARALWNDRGERPRAGQLAEQARDAFSEAGEAAKDDRAEVEAWLGEHRGPSVAAREAP